MKYNKDEIILTQETGEKLSSLFIDNSEELINKLKKTKLDSFHRIITDLNKIIKNKFKVKFSLFNLNLKVNKETLSSGVYTFITFYLLLSILSKGLEKEYNYKITKQTFLLLPYSSTEKLFYTNAVILGKKDESKFKINLNLKIPLLVDSTLKIGEGACPYIRGVNGKNLNDELYESMISFLEELYSEVFIEIIRIYNDKNKNWTPDYANYSLGRFENVNIKHLENNPNIFERVYI